jgi:transcriptional regulator with XRE-family HTH domain
MPEVNRGRIRLLDVIASHSLSDVARELGCSHVAVAKWRDGTSRPTARYRLLLRKRYGIREDLWLSNSERAA